MRSFWLATVKVRRGFFVFLTQKGLGHSQLFIISWTDRVNSKSLLIRPDDSIVEKDWEQSVCVSCIRLTVSCCHPAPALCRETALVLCRPLHFLLLFPVGLLFGCRCIGLLETWPEAELVKTPKMAPDPPWIIHAIGSICGEVQKERVGCFYKSANQ